MTFDCFCKGRKDNYGPDPGKYDVPSTIGCGPKFSMRSRHKELQSQVNPNYLTLPSTLSSKGCTIGPRIKTREIESNNPGPQYYNSTFGKGRSSTFHSRHKEIYDNNPGPGTYDPKTLDRGLSYTCGTGNRSSFIKDNTLVAPGTYDIPSTINQTRPITIGSRARTSAKRAKPREMYDVSHQMGKDAPGYKFPKGPRDPKIEITPGPANYQHLGTMEFSSKKIGPAMHSRPKQRAAEVNEAPYYDIGTTIKPKKMHHGTRPPTSYETISPGPIYDLKPAIEPKLAYIHERSVHDLNKNEVPSPDSYFMTPITPVPPPITGMMGPDSRSPINEKLAKSMPGPADYFVDQTIENKSKPYGFSFGHRTEVDDRPDTDAPYTNLPSSLGGPMFTIGSKDA